MSKAYPFRGAVPVLTAVSLLLAAQARAELVVVIGADSPIDAITRPQLEKIFYGKTKTVGPVSNLTPLDNGENGLKEEFYGKLVGKTPAYMKSYWSKVLFTGAGIPPSEVGSGKEVVATVAKTPGMVAYVRRADLDKSVKVVFALP